MNFIDMTNPNIMTIFIQINSVDIGLLILFTIFLYIIDKNKKQKHKKIKYQAYWYVIFLVGLYGE